MTETKSFASLSSTLLARKGEAKPAMRRQAIHIESLPEQTHDDLGWNDMGLDASPIHSAEPVSLPGIERLPDVEAPVVHEHIETITREFVTPVSIELAVQRAPVERAAPGSKGKAAFTLRLDPERHLRLRLVCAVKHRSAQQIVTQALDAFLATQTDLDQNASAASS